MDAVILFLVIWLVGRIFSALNKKKKGGAGTDKQQQAVEEQKRRREAYQAARRQEAARQHPPTQAQAARQRPQAEDDIPPYRRISEDDDIPPYRRDSAGEQSAAPIERHHIDEAEEERCAEANEERQERRKQELRERFGTAGTRPKARPAATRPNRPQTMVQAQRQLYASSPPSVGRDGLGATSAAAATPAKRQKAADDPQVQRRGVSLQGNALVQGIIMAEVLGPPRSKRKQIR